MKSSWRKDLRNWAQQYTEALSTCPNIQGVAMGGSLARGQEWRHSDLEVGILLEDQQHELPYFNVDQAHGVEIIELIRPELEEQVTKVENGDLTPLAQWPIQLWSGRLIHDPSGLLARFKRQFDGGLFMDGVIQQRIAKLQSSITDHLAEARQRLTADQPAATLVKTRWAMNDAILAFHWSHRELPRSQNRTDSRLHRLCQKYAADAFYRLYRDVYGLEETSVVIRKIWPEARDQILELTRFWGDSAYEFFIHAVDSNFQWRQNAGILTVYRLYIRMCSRGWKSMTSRV